MSKSVKLGALPVYGQYDVVVVGGGVAGCAAAVAAARKGVSVCLVEREYMAGGLATSGIVWCYLPICDGRGNKVSSGICEEFLRLSVQNGSGAVPECWEPDGDLEQRKQIRYETEFNPLTFATRLDSVLVQSRTKMRYGSQLCAVIKDGSHIEGVVVSEKQGMGVLLCNCVIDATGDADVCSLAQEEVAVRTDNRIAYWTYTSENGNFRRHETQVPLYGELPKEERTYCGVDTEDITDFCIEARRRAEDFCVRTGRGMPVMMASIPQLRMSRCLKGRYTLSLDDEGRWFDDCVGMIADWRFRSSVYCVPYAAMVPKKTVNMLVAGRCVSADPTAGDTVRSIPACAVFGQAAGTAAALSVQNSVDVDRISIGLLQRTLMDDGVIIDKTLLCKRYK